MRVEFRSLRWQLVLRTLLPLGLLVISFAVVGQVGYTQVTESLARSRDTEMARLETARVADYMLDAMKSFRQTAQSPVLLTEEHSALVNILREESISQHFDFLQVVDARGNVKASSDGFAGGALLDPSALEYLRGNGLPMTIGPGRLPDGRSAIVVSMRYKDPEGEFSGLLQGGIAYGSQKLAAPMQDLTAAAYQSSAEVSPSGFSYLATADRVILWHPNPIMVGTRTAMIPEHDPANSSSGRAGADIRRIDSVQYVVGYAPINLGQLLTQARPYEHWVQWYVVTQHRWADVVAPVNNVLGILVVLALSIFVMALVLVVRSASRLTIPVGRLVNAAQALTAGRLRHRLDILEISGPLEIEELARQFNSMAEQLQASYASLERKVNERTAELAAANSELTRRLRESQTMQNVAAEFAGTAGLDETLDSVVATSVEAMEAEGSGIFLPSERYPGELVLLKSRNMPGLPEGYRVKISESLTGKTFATGKPQLSAHLAGDPRVDQQAVRKLRATSSLLVPLISQGEVIGVLATINKRAGAFTEDDVRLLTLLANQAAVALERARLYTEAREQVDTLETLNELSLSITASESIEETLEGGMEHLGGLLGATGAAVYLFDEKRRTLQFMADYQLHPAHHLLLAETGTLPIDAKYDRVVGAVEAFRTQEPFVVPDISDASYLAGWEPYVEHASGVDAHETVDMIQAHALVSLPLRVREKPLGSITLYFSHERLITDSEVRIFQSFANILALAVYNTQLVAQTSRLATVEERARLARELHDSVTQSLFSLNLTLRAARRSIGANQEKADGLLDNVQDLAQGALAEMRALIFELRPQALANEGLASALQKHSDSVRARSGLQVHLEVIGDRRLPLDYEEALYQIAREALHNVVKHSHAHQAWVKLEIVGRAVSLSIKDDGKGFEPEVLGQPGGSHIGISTMRERAEAIGGTLELNSCPGCGTEVVVRTVVSDGTAKSGGNGARHEPVGAAGELLRTERPESLGTTPSS